MEDDREGPQKPQKLLRNGCDPRVIGKATQIKPGEVRNPGGRPKRKPMTELLEELAERVMGDPKARDRTLKQLEKTLLSQKVVSVMLLREMADRLEGRVPSNVHIEGDFRFSLADRVQEARQRARQLTEGQPGQELEAMPVIDQEM